MTAGTRIRARSVKAERADKTVGRPGRVVEGRSSDHGANTTDTAHHGGSSLAPSCRDEAEHHQSTPVVEGVKSAYGRLATICINSATPSLT